MPDRSNAAMTCPAWSRFCSRLAPGFPRSRKASLVGGGQLVDIEDIAIVLVLRARARPQEPLDARALGLQFLPARARKQTLVALIGELGVGDRGLAAQIGQRRAQAGIVGLGEALLDELVHRHVDAAYEEARHARDPARVPAPRDHILEAGEVGLDHLFITLLREQQRNIDVDAL